MTQPSSFSRGLTTGLIGERRFRAMNTDVRLVTSDWSQAALLATAEQVFHTIEARFSRFLPDSELSALNASGGEFEVSAEMMALLELALRFHALTDRIFEPAILPALEAAGYDRSFERVEREGAAASGPPPERHSISELRLDRERRLVAKPPGLRLDLGGIGKGCAVDQAATVLAPARDFLIDAGGDIFAAGQAPGRESWRIGVAAPGDPGRDLDVVALQDQAIATSTTAARRWQRGGRWQNHLIDPRTGNPVETAIVSVSVIARSATRADVFAKTALILGEEAGAAFLTKQGAAGYFVFTDGRTAPTPDWPAG